MKISKKLKPLTAEQAEIVKEIIDIQASILIKRCTKQKEARIIKCFDMLGITPEDGLYPFYV
jgi:hypothetical protein